MSVHVTKAPPLLGGQPFPLGAHAIGGGVNFAYPLAEGNHLLIEVFDDSGKKRQARYHLANRHEGIVFGALSDAREGLVYGLRTEGVAHGINPDKLLLDPWAREIVGEATWHPALFNHGEGCNWDSAAFVPKARVVRTPQKYFADTPRPWRRTREEVVIGEAHIRGYTRLHPDIPESLRGTYLGLCHPAITAHWHALGITTLSLQPLSWAMDEQHLHDRGLTNYWGYNPLAFMVPTPRYATAGASAERVRFECQEMIAQLHRAGFEVVVDVVLNHSAEGGENGPTLSFKGLGKHIWYRHHQGGMDNISGCGNTINLAHPVGRQWSLDVLRHWVGYYGVDGFRFDLASILGREAHGFSTHARWFDALLQDPLLSTCRLIAEPWDLGHGGYQLGAFPPPFAEWNDQYRDTVRSYWLGIDGPRGHRGAFAERLVGSSDFFRHNGRKPSASINYLSAHDGFTLYDTLSFSRKHNEENGEGNHDGRDDEHAINLGCEGPTHDPDIVRHRHSLHRTLLACLLISRGTPMIRLGDEGKQSQRGNNNAYCQDNALSWFDWSSLNPEDVAFVGQWVRYRQLLKTFNAPAWFDEPSLQWRSPNNGILSEADWRNPHERALALLYTFEQQGQWWFGFNPHSASMPFVLPQPTQGLWRVLGESTDCLTHGQLINTDTLPLAPYSLCLLHSTSSPLH